MYFYQHRALTIGTHSERRDRPIVNARSQSTNDAMMRCEDDHYTKLIAL